MIAIAYWHALDFDRLLKNLCRVRAMQNQCGRIVANCKMLLRGLLKLAFATAGMGKFLSRLGLLHTLARRLLSLGCFISSILITEKLPNSNIISHFSKSNLATNLSQKVLFVHRREIYYEA